MFDQLRSLCTDEEVAVVRQLRDDVLAQGGKIQPGKGSYPTMSAYMALNGDLRALWAVYADPSGPNAPRISFNFGGWQKSLDDDQLETVLQRLETVGSVSQYMTKVRDSEFTTYPSVPLSALAGSDIPTVLGDALEPYTSAL